MRNPHPKQPPVTVRPNEGKENAVDSQFSMDNIDALIEERPVIARLLVGVIGATAALMVIGIQWAASDASVRWLLIAGALIVAAAALVVVTALPIDCRVLPAGRKSLACRMQGRRFVIDSIAFGLILVVIVSVFSATI